MTVSEQTLLDLIGASLFHNPLSLPDDVDWEAVFHEARQQSVAALIADAVPEAEKAQWTKAAYRNTSNYYRTLHAQEELIRTFSDAGISIGILKGAAAAVYYPVPSRRAMGDIDFLVPQESFERSVELMIQNGYEMTHKSDDPNARHISFSKDGVPFELHHHFSYVDLDIEQYLIEELEHTETGAVDGFAFPMFSPLANGLVLLAHFRHHLMSGVGLRQAIDWMMYVNSVLDDDFWNKRFETAAKRVGMDKLAMTAARMCVLYFGLEDRFAWAHGADDALCGRLVDQLLSSGNFGRKKGVGGKRVETVLTQFRTRGLFRYLQYAGEYNWKAYKKHRWLKPFCWFYQIYRYIRQGIKAKRGRKLFTDADRSKERYALLHDLNIT